MWEWTGGALVSRYSAMHTTSRSAPSGTPYRYFPRQLSVAVGYRADLGGGVPRQRGRSRFFLGPLTVGGLLTGDDTNGGWRLSNAAVDLVVERAKWRIDQLAANDYTLGVFTKGTGTVSPAVELYVDDVFDVQRSRRPWPLYQKRQDL